MSNPIQSHSRVGRVKPKRRAGEGPITYVRRVKYLQVHAELTAFKASLLLDGGRVEEKLRGGA